MYNAITKLNDWSKLSGLNLATHKCSIMSSKGITISSYSINGVQLCYSTTYTKVSRLYQNSMSHSANNLHIYLKYRVIFFLIRLSLAFPWPFENCQKK